MDIISPNPQQTNPSMPQNPNPIPPQPLTVSTPPPVSASAEQTTSIPVNPIPSQQAPVSTSIPISVADTGPTTKPPQPMMDITPATPSNESSQFSAPSQAAGTQDDSSMQGMAAEPMKSTQQSNQMQSPSVFDTNQYHLPLEKGKKHNAGMHMLVFGVVFIVVLVVGGLIAVDAGLIDLGIELPFDIIK